MLSFSTPSAVDTWVLQSFSTGMLLAFVFHKHISNRWVVKNDFLAILGIWSNTCHPHVTCFLQLLRGDNPTAIRLWLSWERCSRRKGESSFVTRRSLVDHMWQNVLKTKSSWLKEYMGIWKASVTNSWGKRFFSPDLNLFCWRGLCGRK